MAVYAMSPMGPPYTGQGQPMMPNMPQQMPPPTQIVSQPSATSGMMANNGTVAIKPGAQMNLNGFQGYGQPNWSQFLEMAYDPATKMLYPKFMNVGPSRTYLSTSMTQDDKNLIMKWYSDLVFTVPKQNVPQWVMTGMQPAAPMVMQ